MATTATNIDKTARTSREMAEAQRDAAEARMVAAQARDRGDAVEERHVQVHHDRVRTELVHQLEGGEPVARGGHHFELFLTLDERAQALEEEVVVVRQENPDSTQARRLGGHWLGR